MTQSAEQGINDVKHIIVAGGGFAGVNCAHKVAANPNVRVTLFDKNNYQQFQPLLYQVANAILAPSNIAFNLRAGVKKYPNIDVRLAEVVSVDLKSHTVQTADGGQYPGDFLVLAAGSQANFFGTPEPSRTPSHSIPSRMPSACVREHWPCWNRHTKTNP